jgi:hypothetical protein
MSTTDNSVKLASIQILSAATGTSNFPSWKPRIRALFAGLNLLGIIDGTEPVPSTTDHQKYQQYLQRLRKSYFILIDHIDDEQLVSVQDLEENPAAAYQALCKVHESQDLSRQFYLVKQLWNTKFDPAITSLSKEGCSFSLQYESDDSNKLIERTCSFSLQYESDEKSYKVKILTKSP